MSSGLRLTIDLDRLSGNWQRLAALSGDSECSAVVKANAYGTAIEQSVPALANSGCKTFFVAVPDEGVRVRGAAPQSDIYVLNGFYPDAAGLYRECRLRPVLGNLAEIDRWKAWRTDEAAALHVDTGMNRLGLPLMETSGINQADLQAAGIGLLMSHLACADIPDHPLNRIQIDRFAGFFRRFSGTPASLANSAGIHIGAAFHLDMVRPGIALYGGASHPDAMSDPVVTCEARVLQIRRVGKGDTIGYGAAQTLQRDSRIATLSAGYADGYMRSAGANDVKTGAHVSIAGHTAAVTGRVSMDLLTVDVTDIPDQVLEGADWAELFGDTIDINAVAAAAGTIAYELLTGLSQRAERIYTCKSGKP